MNIKEIGEFGLIAQLTGRLKTDHPDILTGVGDDAAVLRKTHDEVWLVTIDTMVEQTHFDLSYFTLHQLGQKLMAVNLSDIAAMVGVPRFALISMALSEKMSVEATEELYAGIHEMASRYDTVIIGGDTTRISGPIVLTCTLIGSAKEKSVRTRAMAKPGDLICITGYPGLAAAGISALTQPNRLPQERKSDFSACIARHLTPEPRINEAQFLIERTELHALIDISDGLSSDLYHICEMSGVGAVVFENQLPFHVSLREISALMNKDPLDWALNGGEDFEMLLTIKEDNFGDLKHIFETKFKLILSHIGTITTPETGVQIERKSGAREKLKRKGYDHFNSTEK